jgi:hypothetical protein
VTNYQTFEEFLLASNKEQKIGSKKKFYKKTRHSKHYDARIDVNIGVGHM